MLCCRPIRSRHSRHRLNALAIARHHQTGAVIAKRFGSSRVPDHADQTINKSRKPQRHIPRFRQTHLSPSLAENMSLSTYMILRDKDPRHSDSVRLGVQYRLGDVEGHSAVLIALAYESSDKQIHSNDVIKIAYRESPEE